MRFTRNIDGLSRLTKNREYNRHNKDHYYNYGPLPKKVEQSEDTKVRYDINVTIMQMMAEDKGRVQIEVILTDKYPDYSEYILKMINHRFSKLNKATTEVSKYEKTGEER